MADGSEQRESPNGANHDPNPFNVRQYEQEYGPGGVPPDYTFQAKTPLQNPNAIRFLGVVLFVIACVPIYPATISGFALPGSIYAGLVFLGAATTGVWAFIVANRRQKWLIAKRVPRKDW
ncbi:hypothetical protein [Arthrobacter glacialis]|uniref:Uncharacterized protein n=1 Tax=Arthrobacter glacialis TaxID=1664 RepID=A0A2S3ZYB9_ARTGL|nr:hypothetical protein [Arthrobacter glacialis]POH74193.1 hypothetical protein CVS27_06405 [Arthrobacter glacialis]